MATPRLIGWQKIIDGYPWFEGEGRYPIPAYSEFMPAPRVGRSLYGDIDEALFAANDPHGWRVPEIEEEYELRPGLEHIARQVMGHLLKFGRGHCLAPHRARSTFTRRQSLLVARIGCAAGHLDRERYVLLLPVALSKTQDYLGRVRWTLFGNSEQGPERAFWQSFYTAPKKKFLCASRTHLSAACCRVFMVKQRAPSLISLNSASVSCHQKRTSAFLLACLYAPEMDAALPHRRRDCAGQRLVSADFPAFQRAACSCAGEIPLW
jgi:hypothetical protein